MAEVEYLRVSSVGQNTYRQLTDINLDKTFTDKISATSFNRPKMQACFKYLREGDRLHVHSLDRLT